MAGVLTSAAAVWLPPASAGSFTISPLRVDFSAATVTAALTVRNEDDAPALIQADALLWTQSAGRESLEPTRDVLVSPTVFTLPPKGSQLVRVALRRSPDRERELSYRLVLQEVPPEASPDFNGLHVALRLSLPVFVAPVAPGETELAWSAQRDADGHIQVRADNTGNAHARVLNFTLTPVTGNGPALRDSVVTYVLPGQYRSWTLAGDKKNGDESTATADRYTLKASTERGEVVAELNLAR